jgi:thymidylate synthase (FAD)
MNVKLVSITKSLIDERELTAEELLVYIARVSNPSNQLNMETADKLIGYMVRNKHWSPFEMVDITFDIVTSRAIAQQILRHRSFSFQEFSQRYSAVTEFEDVQLREAGATNRQSSLEPCNPIIEVDLLGERHFTDAENLVKKAIDVSDSVYKALLAAGVAKECARMILPLTTQTRVFMKGSLRSWIHYLQVRTDEHTQIEHREIAIAISEIIKDKFPNVSKALEL